MKTPMACVEELQLQKAQEQTASILQPLMVSEKVALKTGWDEVHGTTL
jgi:hypothetical protein